MYEILNVKMTNETDVNNETTTVAPTSIASSSCSNVAPAMALIEKSENFLISSSKAGKKDVRLVDHFLIFF